MTLRTLRPGRYAVCLTAPKGRTAVAPATNDAAFGGAPCRRVTVAPAGTVSTDLGTTSGA